jgi:hypothetical protein
VPKVQKLVIENCPACSLSLLRACAIYSFPKLESFNNQRVTNSERDISTRPFDPIIGQGTLKVRRRSSSSASNSPTHATSNCSGLPQRLRGVTEMFQPSKHEDEDSKPTCDPVLTDRDAKRVFDEVWDCTVRDAIAVSCAVRLPNVLIHPTESDTRRRTEQKIGRVVCALPLSRPILIRHCAG